MLADALVPLLKELAAAGTDAAVQEEAIETLGDVDNPRAAEALRELARTHPDDQLRMEAVKTLAETAASAESVSLFKSLALSDRSEDVQREAIEALAELADGAGIDTLVELAREHPNVDLRKDALEALFESDHPKAREVVNRALGASPRR
jgi:HEAT repeat protein